MLVKGCIKPRVSLYGSSVLFLPKKPGKFQMCIGFRALNANKKLDVFSLPCIADLLDKFGKTNCFSIKDLATAYHYLRIAKCDMHKTVFFTNEDLYEYIIMTFRLWNAPTIF